MSENNIWKTKFVCKNIIAYICLVNFLINVKSKMNCKTESHFLIMFSMVGRIWIRDSALKVHTVLVPNMYIKIFKLYIFVSFEKVPWVTAFVPFIESVLLSFYCVTEKMNFGNPTISHWLPLYILPIQWEPKLFSCRNSSKYFLLCSREERNSYKLAEHEWVNNDKITTPVKI